MKELLVRISVICLLFITSCSGNSQEQSSNQSSDQIRPVVEVIAADYSFQAPDTIASGWITLRLINERGTEIHELGLAKLPFGKSMGDYLNEIISPWELALKQLQNGEIEASEISVAAHRTLPDWNSEIQYVKSRGLISPGHQTENMMYLEPGNYIIECWVKNTNGEIHSTRGMLRPLTIIETGNNASAPESEYKISLTAEGIETSGIISSGKQIISVDFELNENEQLIYDDVHLIRVEENTDLSEVADWLPWYKIGGLRAPAPAEFLGGVDVYGALLHGDKAYFSINIDPGRYAWIVDAPVEEQVWQEFTVGSGN